MAVVNSINPFRIEGQKTASFEIIEVLGDAPDVHCLPVGNAGNITAYWKGYRHYNSVKKANSLPKMMGWQAAGAAPIVDKRRVEKPRTSATAISIRNPPRRKHAEKARDESGEGSEPGNRKLAPKVHLDSRLGLSRAPE